MAYGDFTFPQVLTDLGLTLAEADLFGHVPPLVMTAEAAERLAYGAGVGAAVATGKARSEFIIAPVLLEARRITGSAFGLFSGVAFDVDPARGLAGFCDFLMTRSPMQLVVTAPVLAVAEAKNDNIRSGFGPCIAGMVAAREFNATAGPPAAVYGVSTTGSAWRFLSLAGDALTIDRVGYAVAELGRIMGVLTHILRDG